MLVILLTNDFRSVNPPLRRSIVASNFTPGEACREYLSRIFTAIIVFRLECAGVLSFYDVSKVMARTHAVSLGLGRRRCPLCGSEEILRSHRRGVLEWTILLLLLLRPFRCRQCSARHLTFFFRRRRRKVVSPVGAESAEE